MIRVDAVSGHVESPSLAELGVEGTVPTLRIPEVVFVFIFSPPSWSYKLCLRLIYMCVNQFTHTLNITVDNGTL